MDPGVFSFPVSNFRLFFSLGAPFPRFCREGPGRNLCPGVQQSLSSEGISIFAVPPKIISYDTPSKFKTPGNGWQNSKPLFSFPTELEGEAKVLHASSSFSCRISSAKVAFSDII